MNTADVARIVSDGFVAAKAGDAIIVYNKVAVFHDNGQLPLKSHYAFGWIIYYALHQTADSSIIERKRLLARYLKLQLEKPHKLHSMVLTEAMRLYKNAREVAFGKRQEEVEKFSIVKFCSLWDLANLRPGDWRRKGYEGKALSSTVEKLITIYVDELEAIHEAPSPEFISVIDKAMSEYPDSFNLQSQRASVYILQGERDKAAELLRNAILSAPGKFFLWSKLASLVSPEENMRLHVALLYKALKAPGQEQFKGRIRLALAKALIAANAFPQALWELQRVKGVYEANGWHLSQSFMGMLAEIPQTTEPLDPEALYKKVEHLADETIYDALPAVHVKKTYHKVPDPNDKNRKGFGRPAIAWRVTDESGTHYWLQPHRFGLQPDLPIGTPLIIRLHNGKPVRAHLHADA